MARPKTGPAPTGVSTVPRSPLLEIEDLAITFDLGQGNTLTAVNGVHLTIHPRQTLAVVGESGCGKSVTALSVLRLLPMPPARMDRGSIRYDGHDLLRYTREDLLRVRGREIAMIFQEPMTSLNPVYTVGDQVTEAILLHQDVDRAGATDMAIEAMADVGITRPERRLKAYPHEFSGGMRQRVMIAMALACQPRLLLADEPTTALDVTIQQQILNLLRELKTAREMGIMLITHDLGIVAETADVVCVMYAGRVVEYARVYDLLENPCHPYTRGLLRSIPRLGQSKRRLTTIADVVNNPEEFQQLPGAHMGIVPWWPGMDPPTMPDTSDRTASDDVHLYEIEPEHWVGCWRSTYLAQHPTRPPDTTFRRDGGPS